MSRQYATQYSIVYTSHTIVEHGSTGHGFDVVLQLATTELMPHWGHNDIGYCQYQSVRD